MSSYKEHELEDDYPVYPGYYYVLDGREYISGSSMTVKELKETMGVQSVKSCDMVERDLLYSPPSESWGRYLDE